MLVPIALAAAALVGFSASAVSQTAPVVASTKLSVTAPTELPTWKIDVVHSELTFGIRHLVSRVRGNFTQWEGTIRADTADWTTGSVEVTIQAASINTGNEKRNAHLRSSDFFDVEKFPTITFKSTKIVREDDDDDDDDDVNVHGNLTIHGVTRPVVLEGELNAIRIGPDGKLRAGFDAELKIKRSDYGITWNRTLDTGGVMLGDEVKILISIAAVKE